MLELIQKDDHKLVSFLSGKKSGLVGFIAIHRGNRNYPSFGATRIWNYSSEEEALRDVLRLSKLMSYKAAMAHLKSGGAKGAIFVKDSNFDKKILLKVYAERVNYFGGRFVTGADVGINRSDVILMRKYSPFIVGIKVDPVRFTGLGLRYSISECLKEVFGTSDAKGRSFAIQGVGKIGQEILKAVYSAANEIFVSDINDEVLAAMKLKYPKIKVVNPSEIHKVKVDVFSPCALAHTITSNTVQELKCKIIVGGANNQLETDDLAEKLHKKNILYAPDYVVNAGGLISVFDEYENKNYRIRRVEKRVSVIKENMKLILSKSKKLSKPPLSVANEIAEQRFNLIV